jgi:hypothetical protein
MVRVGRFTFFTRNVSPLADTAISRPTACSLPRHNIIFAKILNGTHMPKLRATTKNAFFTHFELNGMPGMFRMQKQLWDQQGISIMVQGPSWDGAGINGFGKRHLLATEGGNNAGNPLAKAQGRLAKRQAGAGASSRSAKLTTMIDTYTGGTPADMRDPAVRAAYAAKKTAARTGMERGYASNAYGPNTPICTFVVLDGMSRQDVETAFADAIKAQAIPPGGDAHVTITFPDARVIDAHIDSTVNYYYSIEVQVKHHDSIYHVYHCCGARDPAPPGLATVF